MCNSTEATSVILKQQFNFWESHKIVNIFERFQWLVQIIEERLTKDNSDSLVNYQPIF